MPDTLVRTRGLSKTFRTPGRAVTALRGVDFDLPPNSYTAIMGTSGSGKSTLLNILGCLERPTEGSYELAGRDVSRLSDRELSRFRRQWIGFVFQTFQLIEELDVRANVELPFLYSDLSRTEVRERTLSAIERVGLNHRIDHRPSELSGGEMQRVALARALAPGPLLILADEPTGNLDSETGAEILDTFSELQEEGASLVVVTHDADVAKRAEQTFFMRDGRLRRQE